MCIKEGLLSSTLAGSGDGWLDQCWEPSLLCSGLCRAWLRASSPPCTALHSSPAALLLKLCGRETGEGGVLRNPQKMEVRGPQVGMCVNSLCEKCFEGECAGPHEEPRPLPAVKLCSEPGLELGFGRRRVEAWKGFLGRGHTQATAQSELGEGGGGDL